MKTVTFELKLPIMYAAGNGQQVEANFIELREPTGKVSHICCEIESLIQKGILSMADMLDKETIEQAKERANDVKKEQSDIDSIESPDVDSVMAIMTSGGVNMEKVVLHFRELFRHVAFMGGEKEITQPRMDEMSHTDFRKMMGVYAANFIII